MFMISSELLVLIIVCSLLSTVCAVGSCIMRYIAMRKDLAERKKLKAYIKKIRKQIEEEEEKK